MRRLLVLAAVLTLAGCYHVTVETGLSPSPKTIEKGWAHGFLWGLVPPSTLETQQKCPAGVSKVETQHSFLNELATGITSGLYAPLSIKVTCAEGK